MDGRSLATNRLFPDLLNETLGADAHCHERVTRSKPHATRRYSDDHS